MESKIVIIVGAGTMGSGIAQVAATAGWTVHLVDPVSAALDKAQATIPQNIQRQIESGRVKNGDREVILGRILYGSDFPEAKDVSLAIEAVIEKLDVKQRVFQALERIVSPEALLATNTSSLSVSQIAEGIEHPSRVIGMHFFNPAALMPLVEVIAARQSDRVCVDRGIQIAQQWGKVTVVAQDTPGFIVNRVARGFYLEALRLLDEGAAGIDEIDATMRQHGGFKMGPFQLMDLVGLDVNLAVSTSVWEQMGKPSRLTPHPIQQKLVSQGHLGRKTNRGFYLYEKGSALPTLSVDRKNIALSPLLSDAIRVFTQRAGAVHAGATEQYIFSRILIAILNEAAWALGEEVASTADIDLAMLKGTNYPKGPLAWAESIGHNTVRGVLTALNRTVTDRRYEPAPLLSPER